MKDIFERSLLSSGILLLLLASGCEVPSEDVSSIPPDSLAVWRADVELAVGGDDSEGPGTIQPIPLGASPTGEIFILDPQLLEVQRYDSAGRYRGLLVRSGQGPGEMRSRPVSFGSDDQGIWFDEPPSGRVHFVSFDGEERRVEETGLSFDALGAQSVRIERLRGQANQQYFAETLRVDPSDRSLWPTLQASLYRSDGQVIDTLHEFSLKGRHLALDGGRSSVTFPGPLFHPVAVYNDDNSELVIIERPHQPAGTIAIQVMDVSGAVMRRHELRVGTPEITLDRRETTKDRLLTLASFGGTRSLDPILRRDLEQIVDELPPRFPAFDVATLGPAGTLWLRRAGLELDDEREWLVLDGSLNPVARALVPIAASDLSFRNDGAWWAVMDAWIGEPYVVRLSFGEPQPW